MGSPSEASLGIYVHIPFCVRKCHYCDFNAGPAGEEVRADYVEALCGEIRASPWRGSTVRSLYFGGGTPSELSGVQLRKIVSELRDGFRFSPDGEHTVEANPGTVTRESLAEMREMGFNRTSMGVQSFHDHHLAALGRIHNAAEAVEAIGWTREVGFASRSLDLIFALPNQTIEEWRSDVARAVELRPEHISLYGLTIESGTEFGRRHAAGELPLVEEDLAADMYEYAIDALPVAGYEQYEIANWSLPGHRSRHNAIYWQNEPYLGFGVSAASYIDGVRWTNVANARIYAERVAAGERCNGPEERLTGVRAAGEALMLALRLRDGADLAALSSRYELDFRHHFGTTLAQLTEDGLLESCNARLYLTRQGLLLANVVFRELLAPSS